MEMIDTLLLTMKTELYEIVWIDQFRNYISDPTLSGQYSKNINAAIVNDSTASFVRNLLAEENFLRFIYTYL